MKSRTADAGRLRGLKTITATSPTEKIQDILDKGGLSNVRVAEVIGQRVRLWAPDFADWVLAKVKLRDCGYMPEKI